MLYRLEKNVNLLKTIQTTRRNIKSVFIAIRYSQVKTVSSLRIEFLRCLLESFLIQ